MRSAPCQTVAALIINQSDVINRRRIMKNDRIKVTRGEPVFTYCSSTFSLFSNVIANDRTRSHSVIIQLNKNRSKYFLSKYLRKFKWSASDFSQELYTQNISWNYYFAIIIVNNIIVSIQNIIAIILFFLKILWTRGQKWREKRNLKITRDFIFHRRLRYSRNKLISI